MTKETLKLKDFRLPKNKEIFVLYFDESNKLKVMKYGKKGDIDKNFLNMEVVDDNEEDDFVEVWVK